MAERSSTIAGEGYRATPIVEPWGDAGWKSLGTQLFASREDAWLFAESEYGSLGGD